MQMKKMAVVPAVLAMTSLLAQAQTSSLTGSYVLVEQGSAARGRAATLAQLTFTSGGSVTGRLVNPDPNGATWIDLLGHYTFEGSGIGTLDLHRTTEDQEGNVHTQTMRYRFAVSGSEIQAIRADVDTLAVAQLLPSRAELSGAYLLSEVNTQNSRSRVLSLRVDNTGLVSGMNLERVLSNVNVTAVNGSYTRTGSGTGSLQLSSSTEDAEGNALLAVESYLVLPSAEGGVLHRTGRVNYEVLTLAQ